MFLFIVDQKQTFCFILGMATSITDQMIQAERLAQTDAEAFRSHNLGATDIYESLRELSADGRLYYVSQLLCCVPGANIQVGDAIRNFIS